MGKNLSLQVFMNNGLFPFLYCDASLSPLSSPNPLPLAIKPILAAHLEGWKREREGWTSYEHLRYIKQVWHIAGIYTPWRDVMPCDLMLDNSDLIEIIQWRWMWGGEYLSMCFCLPVREVSPMQPAAMMTPNTAAASSSSTTLVLGSRLCITAHTKQCRSTVNSGIFKPCVCIIHQFRICSNNVSLSEMWLFTLTEHYLHLLNLHKKKKKKITAVRFEQSHFKPYQIPACASEDNVTFT